MKPKKNVSYFPVSSSEHALLLRVREADLAPVVDQLGEMLDLIAEAKLTAAELEQAIQLLVASRQGEGLDARFDNLEGRLKERIEKALAEMEGRLSRRLGDGQTGTSSEQTSDGRPGRTPAPKPPGPTKPFDLEHDEVPKEASIAFRIGRELVRGPSAAQFYLSVWRWLFEKGLVKLSDLPISSGKRRYVVATSPVHPSGKSFVLATQPAPGAYLEMNLSRSDILQRARKQLTHRGVVFEVVVGSEG